MEDLGTILYKRREELGLSIEEVSKTLKIRSLYLSAIEAGEEEARKKLPSVYFNGYIKAYSKHLGVEDDLSDMLPQADKSEILSCHNTNEKLQKNAKPNLPIMAFSAISMVIIYLTWSNFANNKHNEVEKDLTHINQMKYDDKIQPKQEENVSETEEMSNNFKFNRKLDNSFRRVIGK